MVGGPSESHRGPGLVQKLSPASAVSWAGHGRRGRRSRGADRGLLRAGLDRRPSRGPAKRTVDCRDAGRRISPRRRDHRRDRGARRGGERREGRHQRRHGGLPARVPARGGRRHPGPVPPAVRLPRAREQHGRLGHGVDRERARRPAHRHELRQQRVRPGHARQCHDRPRGAPHHDERDEHAARLPRPRDPRQPWQVLVLLRRERGRPSVGAAARRARVPPRSKRRHRVRVEQPLPGVQPARRDARAPAPLLRRRPLPSRHAQPARLQPVARRVRGRARRRPAPEPLDQGRRAGLSHGACPPHDRRSQARGRRPGEVEPADEHTYKHAFERPEDILIVCAGGQAGSWSACLPGWGNKWTRSVTTVIDIT